MDINRLPITLCVILTLLLCILTNFVRTAALDLPADIQKRSINAVGIDIVPFHLHM